MRYFIFLFLIIFSSNVFAYHRIAIVQHQNLYTYEMIKNGFIENIPESFVVTHYNGEGDIKKIESDIDQFKPENTDLIFCLGTISSKIVIQKIKNIPIIITGLGAPGYSGIINDWKSSGSNFTGIEIKNRAYNSLRILNNYLNIKKLGFMYLSKAPSHLGTLKEIIKFTSTNNIELITTTFDNRDKDRKKLPRKVIDEAIKNSLDCILPNCDFFYLTISKTFSDHFETIHKKLIKYKVPSIGSNIYFNFGITIGIYTNPFFKGKACAQYAKMILLDNFLPSCLPFEIEPKFEIHYDSGQAELIDFKPNFNFIINSQIYSK